MQSYRNTTEMGGVGGGEGGLIGSVLEGVVGGF